MTRSDAGVIPRHFSTIAARYNELRATDSQVVDLMAAALSRHPAITAADVGCGTGRYMVELMSGLGDKIFTYFIDCSPPMLAQLRRDLERRGLSRFDVLVAPAERLPLHDRSLDCMLAFNALHHFDAAGFLQEARRTLRRRGLLFIYTRFRDQNRRGIWGRHFPDFQKKERRLHDRARLTALIGSMSGLVLRDATDFCFKRVATPAQLVEQARNKHYSTFCFYSPHELEEAVRRFEADLHQNFGASGTVEWLDENAMLVVERT